LGKVAGGSHGEDWFRPWKTSKKKKCNAEVENTPSASWEPSSLVERKTIGENRGVSNQEEYKQKS